MFFALAPRLQFKSFLYSGAVQSPCRLYATNPYSNTMLRKASFILMGLILFPIILLSQDKKNNLLNKFVKADSVVLVSHLTTGVPQVDELTGKFMGSLKLVSMQKVNDSIINGRAILSASDLDTLASLLTAPYTKREIEDIRCFLPHHGILIYRKPDAHTLIFALAAGIL